MTYFSLLLVLTSVLLSACAQLALKLGVSRPHVAEAIARGEFYPSAIALLTSPEVVGGLSLYGLGAVVWLFVLAKLDLSVAYPFVGLGFLVTMFFGVYFIGEAVSLTRLLGTLLIVAGCALVARSA